MITYVALENQKSNFVLFTGAIALNQGCLTLEEISILNWLPFCLKKKQ